MKFVGGAGGSTVYKGKRKHKLSASKLLTTCKVHINHRQHRMNFSLSVVQSCHKF